MKLIGSLLLAAGFLAGAFVSVAQVEAVNWTHYGVCAGLMLVGMLTLRAGRVAKIGQAGDKHEADIAVLENSLASLIQKVRAMEEARSDEEQLALHHRIDDELMEDIGAFVEARESMIPTLGMQRYADVMSPFANGERHLNRAWSASADGYVDEVRSCIRTARGELEKAAAELASA
ncbi:MAG: hypothetical protein AAFZ87_14660 [Planctomycetota bacterium]